MKAESTDTGSIESTGALEFVSLIKYFKVTIKIEIILGVRGFLRFGVYELPGILRGLLENNVALEVRG